MRRNPNITHIVQNNMVYGLTKGQYAPTASPTAPPTTNLINLPTALIGSSSMASLPSPMANRQATERDASCASAVKRQRLATGK
jgi:hypothetical protein